MKYCDLKLQEGRHPIPLTTQLSWVGKSYHYPTKLPELQLIFTKPSSGYSTNPAFRPPIMTVIYVVTVPGSIDLCF